jgi:hypothetical protein
VSTVIASILLAAPQPGDYDPSTGKGAEWGKAAPIGLLVILLLGVAFVFLVRSFTRQLKKVPDSFDPPEQAPAGPDETTLKVPADAARVPATPAELASDAGPSAGDDKRPG